MSRETVEWVLCRDEADVRCTRRDTQMGIELSITFRGLLVARCVTSTVDHASEWASRLRESWQAVGFEMLGAPAAERLSAQV